MVRGIGRRANVGIPRIAPQNRRLVTCREINDVYEGNLAVLARIVTALKYREIQQVRRIQLKPPDDGAPQGIRPGIKRQRQFGETNQGRILAS
jgi:hypothetical protein